MVVVHKLATVCFRQALAHGGKKARSLFDQAESSLFYNLFGGRAGMSGNLPQLGFLLWGEVNFHDPLVLLSRPPYDDASEELRAVIEDGVNGRERRPCFHFLPSAAFAASKAAS